MSNSLSIALKGSSVGLSDLMDALRHFSTVLDEVDQQVTGQRSMEWKLTKLQYSSAAVGVTPVLRQNDLFDQRAEVVAACASGIERLVERADRPPYFSDRALASARSLAKLSRGDVTGVMLETVQDNGPPARVLLGATIVEHVDEVLGLSRHATGALEGRLETITIHDRNAFTIYDPLRRYGTRCICDTETLNEALIVIHLHRPPLIPRVAGVSMMLAERVQASRCLGGQRSPRLKVIASKGRMLTGSSSFALAIRSHCPSCSSNASRVRSIGSTSHRYPTPSRA